MLELSIADVVGYSRPRFFFCLAVDNTAQVLRKQGLVQLDIVG